MLGRLSLTCTMILDSQRCTKIVQVSNTKNQRHTCQAFAYGASKNSAMIPPLYVLGNRRFFGIDGLVCVSMPFGLSKLLQRGDLH